MSAVIKLLAALLLVLVICSAIAVGAPWVLVGGVIGFAVGTVFTVLAGRPVDAVWQALEQR